MTARRETGDRAHRPAPTGSGAGPGAPGPAVLDALDDVWRCAQAAWRARQQVAESMAAARRAGATDRRIAEVSGLSVAAVNAYIRQRRRPRRQVGQPPPRHRVPGGSPVHRGRPVPPPPGRPGRTAAGPGKIRPDPQAALLAVWQEAQFAYRARQAVAQAMAGARRTGAGDGVIARASGLSPRAVDAYVHQHERHVLGSQHPGATTYVGRMPPGPPAGPA